MSKKVEVTIKKVTSNEPNVSKRHITYDVYHNGEYHTTFNDVNDALDHKEKMQKEEIELEDTDLEEKVLTIQQRQKRAQIMRRYKSKIERSREIAQKRMAPESNIRKRAFVQARQLIRRRVAGERGAEYEKLGPSEKIAIDRAVEGKQQLIKKLALRLIPRIKQAESKRLASYMKGQSIENQGQPEGKSKESSGSSSVKEDLNILFTEAFPPYDTSTALGQKAELPIATSGKRINNKKSRSNGDTIQQYGKFQEEVENNTTAFAALCKKSDKSGIDLEILGEVYSRGWDAWSEDTNITQQQYAFARVNSYINQGKTYFNEDADLHEMKTVTNRSHAKMLEIKVGGKAHSYKKYSWGLHHPTYGPLKDEKFNSKAEMKAAMEKHPQYNPKLTEEIEIDEGRAPGTPSIKRYTRPDGTTALKSLNKWGKRKDWRDSEGGLAKAREHAGVDKITEARPVNNPEYEKSEKAWDYMRKSWEKEQAAKKKSQASEAFSNWTFSMKPGDKTKVLHGDHKGTRGTVVSKHEGGAVYRIRHNDGTVMKHHISTLSEPIREEVESIDEEIKGWKHAGRDLAKWRSEKGKDVKMVALKKDGNESKLSDATTTHKTEDEAIERHKRMTELNPGKKIRHNLYVDGKLVRTLGEEVEYIDEAQTQNKRSVVNRGPQFKSAPSTKAKTKIQKNDYVIHPETGKTSRVIDTDPKTKTATIRSIGGDESSHSWSDLKHYSAYDAMKKNDATKNEEVQQTNENFMDGKGPGKPGDAARYGLKGKSATELRKIRSSETASPRKKQLAHWMLNMHHNESVDEGLKDPKDNPCWKGYKPVGTKKLRGKTVPNCVPEAVEKVVGTNCKNCLFWRKDLVRPVSKDEINENGGLKAPSKEYIKMSKEVDLVTLPGKGTVSVKGFCDNDKVKEWVTERMCCALWDNDDTKREYKGDATFMEQESVNTKARKKIEIVDRKPPHTEYTRQAELKNKVIDEEHSNCGTPECCGQCDTAVSEKLGNVQNNPSKRLIGTKSLVKAYKADTPGENKNLNEAFNIAFAAGVGVTLTAKDLGMVMKGGFEYHPSVVEAMDEMEEEVRSADVRGEVVPAHTRVTVDPKTGALKQETIPATVRRAKANKKIIRSGDVHDGEPNA